MPIDESVSFGRDPSNTVALPDLALTRRHCLIALESGRAIRNLGIRDARSAPGDAGGDGP